MRGALQGLASVIAACLAVAACGNSSFSSYDAIDGGAGAGGATSTVSTDVAEGAMVYAARNSPCSRCHGTMGEGQLAPNITGSHTAGIGAWSHAEFADAVRNGKSNLGRTLCAFMPRFSKTDISDAQLAELFAFLMSQKVDVATAWGYQSSACPGK